MSNRINCGNTGYVRLRNGRQLCYAQYGVADGAPIVFCHGFSSSRLEAAMFEGAAQRLGIRLIGIDRPGYGQSDFKPGRRIGDWPSDVKEVTDHLGISRFAVLGVSGGGPYALVCARDLGNCITRLGLVCPLGPLNASEATRNMGRLPALFIALMRHAPQFARAMYQYVLGPVLKRNPRLALTILTSSAPPSDRRVLQDHEIIQKLQNTAQEAFRQGTRAAAWDLYLYVHQWDLNPQAVHAETLLWQGEEDRTTPMHMARAYASQIPNCQSHFLPREGHFSLPVHHMTDILSALIRS